MTKKPAKPTVLPTGYSCHLCGKWNEFGDVVLARWNEKITVKCHSCPAKSEIFRGRVTPIRPKDKLHEKS
jgi:transcription elongation factor Elf1